MPRAKPRKVVSVDFDGVLHEHTSWTPRMGKVQIDLIRQLHAAGYAVAVSTCNDTWRVAAALHDLGLRVKDDTHGRIADWSMGGSTVLVTGRKVWATAYIDDRAVWWRFGTPVEWALDGVAEVERVRMNGTVRANAR